MFFTTFSYKLIFACGTLRLNLLVYMPTTLPVSPLCYYITNYCTEAFILNANLYYRQRPSGTHINSNDQYYNYIIIFIDRF